MPSTIKQNRSLVAFCRILEDFVKKSQNRCIEKVLSEFFMATIPKVPLRYHGQSVLDFIRWFQVCYLQFNQVFRKMSRRIWNIHCRFFFVACEHPYFNTGLAQCFKRDAALILQSVFDTRNTQQCESSFDFVEDPRKISIPVGYIVVCIGKHSIVIFVFANRHGFVCKG